MKPREEEKVFETPEMEVNTYGGAKKFVLNFTTVEK